MKLITLLNREVPLGKALNAAAHMNFGLGHRFKGRPNHDVQVFFGTGAQVREFRQVASAVTRESKGTAVFNDFMHTMNGPDTDQQVKTSRSTPESKLTYLGCTFVAKGVDPRLEKITQECAQLSGYQPHVGDAETQLVDPLDPPKDTQYKHEYTGERIVPDNRICLVLAAKTPLAKTINGAVLSSLAAGQLPIPEELHLIAFGHQGDDTAHGNISYHPYVVLKAQSAAKHQGIIAAGKKMESLRPNPEREEQEGICETTYDEAKQPLATVLFGLRQDTLDAVPRDGTRLFNDELKKTDLVPVSAPSPQATT